MKPLGQWANAECQTGLLHIHCRLAMPLTAKCYTIPLSVNAPCGGNNGFYNPASDMDVLQCGNPFGSVKTDQI